MEAKAIGRYLRVTPRKARYVLDEVRGKSVSEALALLKFIPNEAAVYIRRVVESAAANAEHNYAMDHDILRISTAFADVGPTMKRVHPRAMGRAFRILKRTCHITVVVTEDEKLRKVAAKPKGRRIVGGRGAAPAAAKPVTRAKKAEQTAPAGQPTAQSEGSSAAPGTTE